MGLQKFRLKTGFNMGTLLVNTPKTTSYAFGWGYCFCVYTLNRKCHILSVNITKHFKNYKAKLDEAEATTVIRPRPGQVITRPRPVFWASRPRPGRGLNIPVNLPNARHIHPYIHLQECFPWIFTCAPATVTKQEPCLCVCAKLITTDHKLM